MELKKYVNEIVDIAKTNDMPWDVGKDMFIANIQNAGEEGLPYYPGADEVDYAALKPEWEALSLEERADAKNAFNDWYRENMDIVIAARKAGMRVIPE